MELTESSLGHVVKTPNQTGDKKKAVRREITGTPSRKLGQGTWLRVAGGGEEGEPRRIY